MAAWERTRGRLGNEALNFLNTAVGAALGLLAVGSRSPDRFLPTMSVEFLTRIGELIAEPAVGDFLKTRIFEPGKSVPWEELVKSSTGRPLGVVIDHAAMDVRQSKISTSVAVSQTSVIETK